MKVANSTSIQLSQHSNYRIDIFHLSSFLSQSFSFDYLSRELVWHGLYPPLPLLPEYFFFPHFLFVSSFAISAMMFSTLHLGLAQFFLYILPLIDVTKCKSMLYSLIGRKKPASLDLVRLLFFLLDCPTSLTFLSPLSCLFKCHTLSPTLSIPAHHLRFLTARCLALWDL